MAFVSVTLEGPVGRAIVGHQRSDAAELRRAAARARLEALGNVLAGLTPVATGKSFGIPIRSMGEADRIAHIQRRLQGTGRELVLEGPGAPKIVGL